MFAFSVRSICFAIVAAGFAFAGQAQDAGTQTVLTAAKVEGLIASYPEVKAKGEELREQYDLPDDAGGAAAWQAWAGVGGAKAQLDGLVQQYGFSDFASWIQVLSVTAQAYGFAESGEDIDGQMAQALAEIENNPNIPEAQKEMMRQQLQHSAAAISAMRPSQASIDAVKPYTEELGALFNE